MMEGKLWRSSFHHIILIICTIFYVQRWVFYGLTAWCNKVSISWDIFGEQIFTAGPHSSKCVGITFIS
ncbi:uncharacterized protein METZ01_LOCUS412542 [marine metagenome]|uniref:Uncharacterized protein n=1 Tax=marine metagenome TaxID=408172 RepID=A0A382WNI0_9ZZZZ